MNFFEHPVEWYVEKITRKEYFSFPGFSDAEWLAMEKCKGNGQNRTGGGQLFTYLIGDQLLESFRINEPNYLKAVPLCLKERTVYGEKRMREFLDKNQIENQDFYERDMVTDDLAAGHHLLQKTGIGRWIRPLREMDVVIVGNKFVRGIDYFLPYKHFVEIPKLDVYLEDDWINKYSQKILEYGKPAVYLFSAGFAAAPLIGNLHGKIPNSFLIDMGSSWDCFVGIGGQRGWRAELYKDRERWKNWLRDALEGVDFDMGYAERVLEKGFSREKLYGHENG